MADYICTYRTNYFRVTDEEKYQKLINKLAGEDLEIFDDENSNGMHGFGGTGMGQRRMDADCGPG